MGKSGEGFKELTAHPYQAQAELGVVGPATVALAPTHQRWVDRAIADGRFETASEAVAFALDHLLPSDDAVDRDGAKTAYSRADYVRAGGPYADLICELIESGEFHHPADVVLEGLALLDEHEQTRKAMDAKLKAAIQIGIDQADRGELIPAEEVFARLKSRLKSKPAP